MGTNVETTEKSREDNGGAEKAPGKAIESTVHEDNKLDTPPKMEVSIPNRTSFVVVMLVCIIHPHKLNIVFRAGLNRCHYGQPSLLMTKKDRIQLEITACLSFRMRSIWFQTKTRASN
jgi:hypothetical protein